MAKFYFRITFPAVAALLFSLSGWGCGKKNAEATVPVPKQVAAIEPATSLSATASTPRVAEQPFLRIEAGMHTARINGIRADAAGRLALTVSRDKTARLWELPSGRLLNVLRPRIGEGPLGQVYDGVLSPDGAIAAIGGYFGETVKDESVCLFDTVSGRLLRRIPTDHAVVKITYSGSGRFLAAGLVGNGLRVWEAATGLEMARDEDYRDEVRGLDWHRDDRLVVSGDDGKVRLYELASQLGIQGSIGSSGPHAIKPQVVVTLSQSERPRGVAFSPDGQKIAIGFYQSQSVAIVDGRTLDPVHLPSTSGVSNGDLANVTWSADGRVAAAGGRWGRFGKCMVRFWEKAGEDNLPRDVAAGRMAISGLCPLAGGGAFLYSATDPAWGMILPSGEPRELGAPVTADFRGTYRGVFHLSADASVIATELAPGGKKRARLAVRERRWEMLPPDDKSAPAGLRAAETTSLPIEWQWTEAPKLDGRALFSDLEFGLEEDRGGAHTGLLIAGVSPGESGARAGLVPGAMVLAVGNQIIPKLGPDEIGPAFERMVMKERLAGETVPLSVLFPGEKAPRTVSLSPRVQPNRETSLSVAIATDRRFFILGASASLRRFDADGIEKWRREGALEAAYAVNLSADGALAVVGYGDGTIRWHRADDGRELLAFFAHADGRHWVLWTPEGYYDCSPGGEELIGWQVNRGPDKGADFFPASRFRDTYYRPDVIDRVLDTRDGAEALKLANEAAGKKQTSAVTAASAINQTQPPIVELTVGGAEKKLVLEKGAMGATIRYRVRRSGGAPINNVRVQIDGRPTFQSASIPSNDDAEASVNVPVPAGQCSISLIAENQFSTSQPAVLRVFSNLDVVKASLTKPRLFVLAAGVSDYKNKNECPDLHFAARDASDFTAELRKQEGRLYVSVKWRLLTDADATAANIIDGLDWLKSESKAEDVVMVFFSGHGGNDSSGRYFFCPHDLDSRRLLRTSVGFQDIQRAIATLPGRVLFFVDTCHAGNALGRMSSEPLPNVNRLVNELSSDETGAVVFAASTGKQLSLESSKWNNGAFTSALLEGLGGKADLLGKGRITVASLETFVADRVAQLTEGKQTPTVAKPQTIPDFAIALRGRAEK